MGKYESDLSSDNPQRAVERIEEYLAKQGFWKVGRPGREVWKRAAKSALLSPEYISVAAGDEHVHLEAWIKTVTPLPGVWLGKTDPHSGAPVGGASKDRLRQRLERIEQMVR
jgi:hypothetical protein